MLRAPEPVDLTPQPGVDAMPALIDAARASGLAVGLTVEGNRPALPAGLDLTAYRIVQEALTNVRRHSTAERAEVTLRYAADAVRITVADDGPSRTAAGAPGHGLIGMRERVALFGGRLEAAGAGAGFRVHAELPLEAS
jgi:signal transduction histidine kinase